MSFLKQTFCPVWITGPYHFVTALFEYKVRGEPDETLVQCPQIQCRFRSRRKFRCHVLLFVTQSTDIEIEPSLCLDFPFRFILIIKRHARIIK